MNVSSRHRRLGTALAAAGALVAAAPVTALAQDAGALRVAPTLPDMSGPGVVVEALTNLGMRPRAEGAVQASTEDEWLARWNLGGSADPRHPSNRSGFHVAPRIQVDTVVRAGALPARSPAKGVLSQLAVLAQSRNRGYWPFRVCYEGGLRREPALRGKVEVRFSIGRSGHVTASRLLERDDTFKSGEVARCVATRARGLSFSPAPPRRVDVDMTVELNPGDAALPGVKPAGIEGGAPPAALLPRFTPAQLRDAHAALAARTDAIAACYASGRARDAGLWGRIGLRIAVDARGVRVDEHESRFPDRGVVACVAGVVQSAPFCDQITKPVELEWAVRLGAPPAPAAPAESAQSSRSVLASPADPEDPLLTNQAHRQARKQDR